MNYDPDQTIPIIANWNGDSGFPKVKMVYR